MASQVPPVPPHVEESIAAIAKLHAEHYRRAGAFQRLSQRRPPWLRGRARSA
jgi:hypothetical protein